MQSGHHLDFERTRAGRRPTRQLILLAALWACEHRPSPTTPPFEAAPLPIGASPANTEAPVEPAPSDASNAQSPARSQAQPQAEPQDDAALSITLDVAAIADVGVPLPARTRDGRWLAITAMTALHEPDGPETHEIWLFDLGDVDSALDLDASPTSVLTLVTAEDAREAQTRPTEQTRARILGRVRAAADKLIALGFETPVDASIDYDFVGRGDNMTKRWKIGRFMVSESPDGSTLRVRKGKATVATLTPGYGPEDDGQCLQLLWHEVFAASDPERWYVLTTMQFPGCEPKPRLRLVDPKNLR